MERITLKQRLSKVPKVLIAAFAATSVVPGALKKAVQLAAEKDRKDIEQRNYESK